MGNKIGREWTVESVSPEGAIELMASSGNVYVAKAAYAEAMKHRPGRIVRFVHGAQIMDKRMGWQCEYWLEKPEECGCAACVAGRSQGAIRETSDR